MPKTITFHIQQRYERGGWNDHPPNNEFGTLAAALAGLQREQVAATTRPTRWHGWRIVRRRTTITEEVMVTDDEDENEEAK